MFEKINYTRICFIVLICLGCAIQTQAQQLSFDSTTIDVGTITEDDSAMTYRFHYQNKSTQPITITKADITCGCTQPKYKHSPILPNEKGEICITFFPLGRVGDMHRSIYFHTDKVKDKYAFKLTLTGKVLPSSDPYINYPYAIGPLRLMQTTINFRHITGTRKRMIRIQVVNSGQKNLQLSTSGLPGYISFTSNPVNIAPQEKADLIFIIDPTECKDKRSFKGTFFLNGVGDINPLQRTMNYKGNFE